MSDIWAVEHIHIPLSDSYLAQIQDCRQVPYRMEPRARIREPPDPLYTDKKPLARAAPMSVRFRQLTASFEAEVSGVDIAAEVDRGTKPPLLGSCIARL